MRPFTRLTAVAAPLLRANVDTDAIIPSREMKGVSKDGLAEGLFAGWRYTEIGGRAPNPAFVLNDPAYRRCEVLLAGENFGCGSSREHAVWALSEYGIRAVLAPSFSAIFRGNCVRNGLVPVVLDAVVIASLAEWIQSDPQGRPITVSLEACMVSGPEGRAHRFVIDDEARDMMLGGLDAIDVTLRLKDRIAETIARDRQARPWIYL
jgi:3-isopropylmalate/(R)-2-methylmalate dehydratase small subunit